MLDNVRLKTVARHPKAVAQFWVTAVYALTSRQSRKMNSEKDVRKGLSNMIRRNCRNLNLISKYY